MSEEIDRRGGVEWRPQSRFGGRGGNLLRKVFIANLVVLMGFAVCSFSVPLSDFERWFAVSVVTLLAAVDIVAIEDLRGG